MTDTTKIDRLLPALAQAYESLGDAVNIVDNDDRLVLVNSAWLSLYGYSRDELTNRPLSSVFRSDQVVVNDNMVLNAVDEKWEGEVERTRKNGDDFIAHLTVTHLKGSKGERLGRIAIVRDLSEQKRIENEITLLAQEQKVLADIGRIIGSSLDIDEVYEKFSERVQRLIPHDRIGISMINEDRASATAAYASGHTVPERERASIVEMDLSIAGEVYRQRSGVIFQPVNLRYVMSRFPGLVPSYESGLRSFLAAPLISNDLVIGVLHVESKLENAYYSHDMRTSELVAAQIAGAMANAQLYAQQKEAELAIREAENKFRTIIENASDGIVVLKDRQILYANPAMKVMLGHGFDQGANKDFTSFVYEEDLDMVTRYIALRMQGKPSPDQYELRLKGLQGNIVTAEVRPRAIDLNGEPAIVVLMRDITERNQLHEQLLQSQKLEAIGTLAGGVAHDFNNMLSAIMGFTHLLKGRLNEDETAAWYLEEIKKTSDRASILTNQLLTFSRHQVVKARVINVNQVISNLDGMFRRLIREDIELVHSLEKDLWDAELDPNQMEQILVNLVINARDAMPEGGKLHIKTANESLTDGHLRLASGLKHGDFVTITVRDTGTGMSETVKSRMFEPFFTTKEAGKGTGLGLSTAYGIIVQSDGIIEVDSRPGEGSEIKIYLPRTLAPTESRASDEGDENLPTGTESILVVDDESTVRGATASLLREQGYEVLEATNGIEALELANQRETIHLILTDMVMPIMSGRMLAQHFNEQFPDVKLLFMSGYTDDILIQSEVSGGQVPFLQKPLIPEALVRKVREVLDSP